MSYRNRHDDEYDDEGFGPWGYVPPGYLRPGDTIDMPADDPADHRDDARGADPDAGDRPRYRSEFIDVGPLEGDLSGRRYRDFRAEREGPGGGPRQLGPGTTPDTGRLGASGESPAGALVTHPSRTRSATTLCDIRRPCWRRRTAPDRPRRHGPNMIILEQQRRASA